MLRDLRKYIEESSTADLERMKINLEEEINFTKENQEKHIQEEFLPKYKEELNFIEEVLDSTWNVYSSMLGGFSAMGFKERENAQEYINTFHCEIEKKGMSVSRQKGRKNVHYASCEVNYKG